MILVAVRLFWRISGIRSSSSLACRRRSSSCGMLLLLLTFVG